MYYGAEVIRKNKRRVQSILLNNLGNFHSSILTLLGPSPTEIIDMIFDSGIVYGLERRIISYEVDLDIYISQVNMLSQIPKRKRDRIDINLGDILGAEPERFIDLDLTRTINSEALLIERLFNAQRSRYQDSLEMKCFNFTVCLRDSGHVSSYNEICSFLSNLLNTNIKIFDKRDLNPSKRIIFSSSSDKYYLEAYSYRDTIPMASISIQYV